MSLAYNKVMLMGYLTRDIEMRYSPKGVAVGKFSVAVNRTWKDAEGEEKEDVTFVDCTAFGKTAELLAEYTAKGSPIFVEGRLQQEKWEDKESGDQRSKMSVVCEGFKFLSAGKENGEGRKDHRKQEEEQEPPKKKTAFKKHSEEQERRSSSKRKGSGYDEREDDPDWRV